MHFLTGNLTGKNIPCPQTVPKCNFTLNMVSPTYNLHFFVMIFISNYIHFNWFHLFSNIGIFLLAIFVIACFEVKQERFRKMNYLIFLLLPLLYVLFSFFHRTGSQGFSNIAFAFVGYACYLVYPKRKDDSGLVWFGKTIIILSLVILAIILSLGENTNFLSHIFSFALGIIFALLNRIRAIQ